MWFYFFTQYSAPPAVIPTWLRGNSHRSPTSYLLATLLPPSLTLSCHLSYISGTMSYSSFSLNMLNLPLLCAFYLDTIHTHTQRNPHLPKTSSKVVSSVDPGLPFCWAHHGVHFSLALGAHLHHSIWSVLCDRPSVSLQPPKECLSQGWGLHLSISVWHITGAQKWPE